MPEKLKPGKAGWTSPVQTQNWRQRSMNETDVRIVRATEADLPALAELAGVIWRAHYPGIIPLAQIEYMLAWMYSLATLSDEFRTQHICFEQLFTDERFVGFAAYGPTADPGVMKLHKLYLLPQYHGKGVGASALKEVEGIARGAGAARLVLNVNKHNAKAIRSYQRSGWSVAEAVCVDIGAGFVMDDYVMAKELV